MLNPEYDKIEFGSGTEYIITAKKKNFGVIHLSSGNTTGNIYDYAEFETIRGGTFHEPIGISITIKIFGKTNYENDKVGKITKNLNAVWSNWKKSDINLKK